MTQRNPCRLCERIGDDKNGDDCMRCEKRIQYVEALEGRVASMPVEMTDMVRKAWTPEEIEYLRKNYEGKNDTQIGVALGRSTGCVIRQRFALGLRKSASWRTAWEKLQEKKRIAALDQAEADLAKCPPEKTEKRAASKLISKDEALQRDADALEHAEQEKARVSVASELMPFTGKDFTIIDFQKYEAIYGRLQAAAERDFRTPELQALFYIHRALEQEDGARGGQLPADAAA